MPMAPVSSSVVAWLALAGSSGTLSITSYRKEVFAHPPFSSAMHTTWLVKPLARTVMVPHNVITHQPKSPRCQMPISMKHQLPPFLPMSTWQTCLLANDYLLFLMATRLYLMVPPMLPSQSLRSKDQPTLLPLLDYLYRRSILPTRHCSLSA
jgi:hypothetical protein